MVKRRVKKRTHVGANGAVAPSKKPGDRTPKSLVIRIGASDVGSSVTQLVHDVRSMMEPETATRLKERRTNRLRDYTTMAGPLGVTHLLLFSKSEAGNVQLRLAITPRGPTFCFRVEKYSLAKDIFQSMKRPKSGGMEYLSPPLLVMNNFTSAPQKDGEASQAKQVPKHLETLATTVFQSLFPPINPTTMPLSSIKRVLLLDRIPQEPDADSPSYCLNLRHYAIETRTAKSLPKALRRLDAAQKLASERRKRGQVPNLGKLEDVADYLLDPGAADGFTSASDSEPETDAEVEVFEQKIRKVRNRADQEKQLGREQKDVSSTVLRKGVKLNELGPRMRLRLTKVEEGLCGGKVMWHEWIHKTKDEQAKLERLHQERNRERERRKAEQKANVEKKRAERRASGKGQEEEEDDDEDAEDEDMEDDWEDDEYNGEDADEMEAE